MLIGVVLSLNLFILQYKDNLSQRITPTNDMTFPLSTSLEVSISPNENCRDVIMIKGHFYEESRFSYVVRFYMQSTDSCVAYYFSINPDAVNFLDVLKAEFPTRFFYAVEQSPQFKGGVGNRNAQRYHIARNFEMIRRDLPSAEWILQIRSDQIIRLPNATRVFAAMVQSSPITDTRGTGAQKMRMITSSRVSFGDYSGWCHIDDHFMFGHMDDLELYWVRLHL
jgi:hypothetical protein